MALPVLHIGDKNYSSWSMRPWLALKHGGIAFEERLHPLPDQSSGQPAFSSLSPTGRVPALHLGDGVIIAESLAICEWAAEQKPDLWPSDPTMRALARTSATIMHSGFAALRNEAPMNIRRKSDAKRMTRDGLNDAAMMDKMWCEWLGKSGGPFLFGAWSIADAMYAPATTRFTTYAIPRSKDADRYIQAIAKEPHAAAWIAAAMNETHQLSRIDVA